MHGSRFPLFWVAAALSLASGCWSSQGMCSGAPNDNATDTDADSDSDSDSDVDSDSDSDTGSDVDSETGSDTGSDVDSETESDTFPCDNGVWTGDFFTDESLAALAGYTEVTGNLYIIDDDALEDLSDLACLTHVGGTLWISATSLVSFSGLGSLQAAGWIIISDNSYLPDLEGLGSLAHAGNVDIRNNPALVSVDGVEAFTGIPQELHIRFNPVLANLDGLGNIVGGEWVGWMSYLDIQSNPELPNCEAIGLRDQLAGPPYNVCIADNLADECPEDTATCWP